MEGHHAGVSCLAFSPDGQRIVSGGSDRLIILWDVQTGKLILTLRGHEGGVTGIAFSPDGRWFVSASADHTLKIWDAAPLDTQSQEREAMLAAEPEAKRIVDILWEQLDDWKSVGKRLRADTSLSKVVRRAALNEVLRRAVGRSGS